MQVIYAFQQSEVKDIKQQEKSLLASVDKVFEMYINLLALIVDVVQYAEIDAIDRANKHLPSDEDKNANLKVIDNRFIKLLLDNNDYLNAVKKYKVSWSFDPELARSLFSTLKNSEEYKAYLLKTDDDLHSDKDIIKFIFKKVILKSTLAQQALEEQHINWQVDQDVLQAQIITLKGQLELVKQKLENEKNKVVKPEPNPDTGEVPLRTGIANAILDKKKDTKDIKDLVQSKKKKEIKVGGKTNIEINPDVDIGNFSGGMKTNAGNLH